MKGTTSEFPNNDSRGQIKINYGPFELAFAWFFLPILSARNIAMLCSNS